MRRVSGRETNQARLRRDGHGVELVYVWGLGERVGAGIPCTCYSHGIFKPPLEDILSEQKSKDRQSAKEWEHVISPDVWFELKLSALEVEGYSDRRGVFGRCWEEEKTFLNRLVS